MKKPTLTILTILILTLTACGSTSNGANSASDNQNTASAGALPATTQLLIGTLKLEDTEQAVTAKQATELLPLWQTMQVLSESDTAADQEKEALIAQIQETMTPAQRQAIASMNLTRQDLFTVMQEQGVALGGSSQSNSQSRNSSTNSSNFGGGGGEFPAGGGPPPDGAVSRGSGGFGGQGSGLSPDQIATAQASRTQRSGSFLPPALINALIKSLEEKAGS